MDRVEQKVAFVVRRVSTECAEAPHERKLRYVECIDVRIAQLDGTRKHRRPFQELVLVGDQQDGQIGRAHV